MFLDEIVSNEIFGDSGDIDSNTCTLLMIYMW